MLWVPHTVAVNRVGAGGRTDSSSTPLKPHQAQNKSHESQTQKQSSQGGKEKKREGGREGRSHCLISNCQGRVAGWRHSPFFSVNHVGRVFPRPWARGRQWPWSLWILKSMLSEWNESFLSLGAERGKWDWFLVPDAPQGWKNLTCPTLPSSGPLLPSPMPFADNHTSHWCSFLILAIFLGCKPFKPVLLVAKLGHLKISLVEWQMKKRQRVSLFSAKPSQNH